MFDVETEHRPRRLLVLLPMVWSVRNVVYSGVLDLLVDAGVEVHLAVPGPDGMVAAIEKCAAFSAASSCSQMIKLEKDDGFTTSFLNNVMKRSLHRFAGHRGQTIGQRWLERAAPLRRRLKSASARGLSTIVGSRLFFCGFRAAYRRRMNRRGLHPQVVDQVRAIAPDVLWCTVWGVAGEDPYVFASDRLGIPAIASIVGFDNPFTFGVRPKFSRYLVWNDMMKQSVQRGDPSISDDAVTVTGTPQFDFHRRETAIWTRERALNHLGVSGASRFFVYSASHELHTPGEPVLVQRLADVIGSDQALKEHVIVVRLHPLDNAERWARVTEFSDRVVISRPFNPPCDKDGWTVSSLEDQELLVSSLRHADACINIASTIALDAAIMDCPVIAIDFSSETDRPEGLFFEEYKTDYYKPLVASGGLDIARSWGDLKTVLRAVSADPGRGRAGRERMVRTVCGKVDGHSARRVADAVFASLEGAVNSEQQADFDHG